MSAPSPVPSPQPRLHWPPVSRSRTPAAGGGGAHPHSLIPGVDPMVTSPSLAAIIVPFLDAIAESLPPMFIPVVFEKRHALIAGTLPEQLRAIMDLRAILAQFPVYQELDRLLMSWPLWNQYAPLLHQEMMFFRPPQPAAQPAQYYWQSPPRQGPM
jgi:hypothetical protein